MNNGSKMMANEFVKALTFRNRDIFFYTYNKDQKINVNDILVKNFVTVLYEVPENLITQEFVTSLYDLGTRYYCAIGNNAKSVEDALDYYLVLNDMENEVLDHSVTVSDVDVNAGLWFSIFNAYTKKLNDPIVVISDDKNKDLLIKQIEKLEE